MGRMLRAKSTALFRLERGSITELHSHYLQPGFLKLFTNVL